MTTPVGGIGVTITADATPAASGIEDAMDKAMAAMVANATAAFGRVETAANQAGATTGTATTGGATRAAASMDQIAAGAVDSFGRVTAAANASGEATATSTAGGATRAAASMDQIATGAVSTFSRVSAAAAASGDATSTSVSGGATRAALSLDQIATGAASSFGRVTAAAASSGEATGTSTAAGATRAAASLDQIAVGAGGTFSRVSAAAAASGDATGAAMSGGSAHAAASMDQIAVGARGAFTRVEQTAAEAGNATGTSMTGGAARAAGSLDGIATSAASSFARVERGGLGAGSAVGDSMTQGAAQAGTRLDGLAASAQGSMARVDRAAADAGNSIGTHIAEGTHTAEGALEGLKGKMAGLAAAATAVGGAGATAGFMSDQAVSGDKLNAQLGLDKAPELAAQYGKSAAKIYASNWGENLGAVNDAMVAVNNAGLVNEDASGAEVESVTTKAIALSQAFGVDVTEAARAAGQMMKTGLAPDAATAFDVMTRGYQQGTNVAGDYTDSLNEYGVQFQKLGIDGAAATVLMGQGLKAGARDSDIVADAFKEFSIRAIDGSKTTGDAFTALGMDGADMSKRIAEGGPVAAAATQEVLDKLRNMQDPVAKAAAATGLFGTQSEDLGRAMDALDLGKAAGGLGDVAGAAQRVADGLGDNAAGKIESFKRSVQVNISDFIGTTVIPALESFGGWFSRNSDTIANIAIPLGIVTAGMVAMGIASSASAAGGIGALLAKLPLATAATWLFGAAQEFLAAVMDANPLALVVLAVAALAAGFIWAWNNVDGFATGVQAAWSWIKDAAVMVWEGYLKPILAALGDLVTWLWTNVIQVYFQLMWEYWTLLANAAMWAWTNILQPVIAFLGEAAMWLWTNAIQPAFAGIMTAWQWISDAATWAWTNILQPIFAFIGDAATWLWANAIQPAFAGIMQAWTWISDAATWAWANIMQPIFGFIGDAANFLWNSVLSPAFAGIVQVWNVLWTAISWAWDNVFGPVFGFIAEAGKVMAALILTVVVGPLLIAWQLLSDGASAMWNLVIQPVFNNMGSIISGIWTSILQPVFNAFMDILRFLGDVFAFMWNNVIRPAWDALQAGLSAVYNNILVPMFNAFMDILRFLGDSFTFIWNNVIRPLWDALGAGIRFVYDNVLKPMFDAFMDILRFLGDAFTFIWNNVIRPLWDALSNGLRVVYDNVVRPLFDAFMAVLRVLGDAFTFIWDNVIRPLWDKLTAGLQFGYDRGIQPMFDGFHKALEFLQSAFESVVGAIGTIWDKIKELAAAPVRFVIDTVYNKGIKVAVNWVMDKLGMDSLKLPDLKAEFAAGGVMPGYTPGQDVHQFTSPTGGRLALSGGEAIMRPEWTRAVGGPGAVDAMNAAARTGNMANYSRGGVAGFADGGTWQQLDAMRADMFPGSVMTSGYRSSGGGYHQKGEAIDIGVAGNSQEGLMPIADALMAKFPSASQIIHNPNGSRSEGKNVGPEYWGEPTWSQHADHVHWAMTPEALGGTQGGGVLSAIGGFISKVGSIASEVAGLISDPVGTIKGKFPDMFASFSSLGDSPFVKAIANLPNKAMDGIKDKVKGWVGLGGSKDPGGGGGAARWRDMAIKAINYVGGIDPSEANINAMMSQINSESSGNPGITQGGYVDVNTGGNEAVGLLQIAKGTWPDVRDPALPDDRTDPFANMVGALRYYKGKYGTDLTSVWGHNHGYALGGVFDAYAAMAQGGILDSLPRFAKGAIVDRPTVGVFGEAGPEAIVPLGDGAARDDVLARAGLGGSNTRTIHAPITIYAQDPVATGRAVSTALLELSNG